MICYQMLPSIISTACVMLYCVFVYIVSGCSCVAFHVQLKLEVWRQVEDPSNPGRFYYYNQAWRQNRWRIRWFWTFNFRGYRWDNLGSSCRIWGEALGFLWYLWWLFRQDFEISGNYQEMFFTNKRRWYPQHQRASLKWILITTFSLPLMYWLSMQHEASIVAKYKSIRSKYNGILSKYKNSLSEYKSILSNYKSTLSE